jgi:hypothetical protein
MKHGRLKRVFPNDQVHAEIARLLVLYEDLKIESYGITEKILGLSTTNRGEYVSRYFLRRAIATLSECANCMVSLEKNPDFRRIKERCFPKDALEAWKNAAELLQDKSKKWLIRSVRNDVGGHFGVKAAQRALAGFNEGTVGSIEFGRDYETARERIDCHFVGEITARAFLRDQSKDPEVEFKKLMDVVSGVHKVVLDAIPWLIARYVWPRFGRQ